MQKPSLPALFLRDNIQRIVSLWEIRIRQEIYAARAQDKAILRDEIPDFLNYLADSLAGAGTTGENQEKAKVERRRVAEGHGAQRAATGSYSLEEAIFEYHILRLVIFQVLEEVRPLDLIEREIIVSIVEQAVQDMATEFAKSELEMHDLFVLTLVHDLRGPLNNAAMALQLIDRVDSPTMRDSAKSTIKKSLAMIDRMTADLLDARKVTAGGSLPLKFQEFDLVHVAKDTIADFKLGDRIRLVAASEARGHWSVDGIRRALENLIVNALKYGKSDGIVTVTIDQTPSFTAVAVHNEGEPIPLAHQASIFESFFQTGAGSAKGWGIGLALVKGITAAHAGKVSVESSKEKGTTFKITLPLRKLATP